VSLQIELLVAATTYSTVGGRMKEKIGDQKFVQLTLADLIMHDHEEA
jgi:hypothetical protein